MQAHRIEKVVQPNGTLILENLPFEAGKTVEIIVLEKQTKAKAKNEYPLRGTPYKYDDPFAPVVPPRRLGRFTMIVLDTHEWIWHVQGDQRLPTSHVQLIQKYESIELGVSAISLWEVAKAVEYGRLSLPISVGD